LPVAELGDAGGEPSRLRDVPAVLQKVREPGQLVGDLLLGDEAHRPLLELTRGHRLAQEDDEARVAVVFGDAREHGVELGSFALEHLQERALMVEQHPGEASPGVVEPRPEQDARQVELAEVFHGGTSLEPYLPTVPFGHLPAPFRLSA
jgi:hypothetical protein